VITLPSNIEISHINDIPDIDVSVEKGRHARKIMNAFAIRWGDSSETNLLHILGLFDRPADQAAIESIIGQHIISGLTDHLQNQSEAKWLLMLEKLRNARLIAHKSAHHPDTLDCHPLVREHFGESLHQSHSQAWQQAHERLYGYYKNLPKQQLPDTLEDMAPLFSAVAHGCMAGNYQEVLDDVFWERIRRKSDAYVVKQLGAFSTYLAALSSFFEIPWHQPAAGLTDDAKPFVLSWAGFSLRALGRLQEASVPMKAGLDAAIQDEDWEGAAQDAGNLSELFLTLGKVNAAVDYARQSVAFADKSWDDFQRESKRTTLADALHQSGEFTEADRLFREAEGMQKESQPGYSFLYSLRGFRFCDFLLSQGRYGEVIERASQTLEWAKKNHAPLLIFALDTLSLGRAHLLQTLEQKSSNFKPAETYLNDAVEGLRKAGTQHHIPRGLLSRAALYREQKNFTRAWEDLDEILEIAEQGK
jgi:tetratricopeptide (TPR) repeat protein